MWQVTGRVTRAGLLRFAAAGVAALYAAPRGLAAAAGSTAPRLFRIKVRNTGARYAGDRRLFATVSPGVRGRDTAAVDFFLERAATVRLEAIRAVSLKRRDVVWRHARRLSPGHHALRWAPPAGTPVGSYLARLVVEDGATGARRIYGGRKSFVPGRSRGPVVRVLGIEAAFERTSYRPFEPMRLTIRADVPSLRLTFLRVGWESVASLRFDEIGGAPAGEPVRLDWTGKRAGARTIEIQADSWPHGLYAVRLEAPDGRAGFAPFVLRPTAPNPSRTAIVLPTNTWQAYNFHDADGDGFGDTWYAGGDPPVRLDRPYRDRGVPPRFNRYDNRFLQWLRRTGRTPDVLTEDDLEAIPSGNELRRRYDLVAFPGHTEYVTEHAYDVVERYRDRGGRLIFLSANNFFWKVRRRGRSIRRVALWRDLGRPEARLIGGQYKANDGGRAQGVYYVLGADRAPWLFAGTGLRNYSRLGDVVGGYGIEIDGTTKDSPPGTQVLAIVPSLLGPGLHGEMTYYETPAGARVFAAGTLDFGTSVMTWPVWKLVDNLWRHMLEDVPRPPA